MLRLLLIVSKFLITSCKIAYPEQIRIVGTYEVINKGYCGILCLGGLIKVDLAQKITGYNHQYIYLITACLPLNPEQEGQIDVTATLHTGNEKECYYQSFAKAENIDIPVLYKMSESETSEIK